MNEKKSYTVYILLNRFNRYYTGITNNLFRRLSEHTSGKSKSTKRFLPVKLIYTEEFFTRIEARKREVYIKRKGAKTYLRLVKFSPEFICTPDNSKFHIIQ